jgi:hypothetical protein
MEVQAGKKDGPAESLPASSWKEEMGQMFDDMR